MVFFRRIAVILLWVLAVFQSGGGISAHELERTTVFITFSDDGAYLIDVLNDPNWLLARVESFSGLPPSGRLDPGARDERLAQMVDTFTERVNVYFDDVRVDVLAKYLPTDPSLPNDPDNSLLGTMRLRGLMPEGIRTFRWSYGYVIDPYPVLIQAGDGEWVTSWVNGEYDSETFELATLRPPTRWMVVQTYLDLGFTHIMPKGLDHMLFVIGIYLLSTRLRPISAQVTAFTVAHTLTLGLTIYDVFALPSRIIEPLIALSIAYVTVENLVTSEFKP